MNLTRQSLKRWFGLSTAGLFLFLCACGGGSAGTAGGSPTNNTPATPADGIYFGSYTVNGGAVVNIYGVAEAGGFSYFGDTQGTVYVLPPIPSSGSLSGTLSGYASPGNTFSNGATTTTFSLTGTASQSTISGTFSGGGDSGTFSLSRQTTQAATLASLAGSYAGFYFGTGTASMNVTLNSNGTLSGTDSLGCAITGSLSVDQFGLLAVTATSSCSAGPFSGLGFAWNSDLSANGPANTGQYVYFGAANGTSAFALQLKKQ